MRQFLKSSFAVLLLLAAFPAVRCMQPDIIQTDELSVAVDASLVSLHKVKVTLLDSAGTPLEVLYDDSLGSLSALGHLRLTTPYRGVVVVRIEGERDGKVAYEEERRFDLASRDLLESHVVYDPARHVSRPPVITGLPAQVEVFAGDTLRLSGTARDSDGVVAYYAWNFSGGEKPDTTVASHDPVVSFSGRFVYGAAGARSAILIVSDSMNIVRDTVAVTVKPRASGSLPLEALAGDDVAAATDSVVWLRGRSRGGEGPVVKMEWRIGTGAFAATASGDTAAVMPGEPGQVMAVLRVTDSSGQWAQDSAVLTALASGNASLSSLGLTGGVPLDPLFKPETENYTASVPWGTTRIGVGASARHRAATVKVGQEYLGRGDTAQVTLQAGENPIALTVLSQSGVQKVYRLTVYRGKNPDAKLSGLEVAAGELSPKFHADTLEYRVGVGNEVASVGLRATAHDSAGATLLLATEGAGDTLTLQSGVLSAPQNLDVGARAFQVWVTAQDGVTRRRYRVSVTRQASPNATLTALVPSAGSLRPEFAELTAEYFDTVGHAQDKLQLRGVAKSDKAALFQGGKAVASGVDGPAAALPVGDTTLSVVVKAESGDTNTYRVRVHRKSDDATLKSLAASVGLKGFSPGVESYADTVAPGVAGVTLTPALSNRLGTVAVNGKSVPNGTAAAVGLQDGPNGITVVVTSEEGNKKTYVWNVYRTSANNALGGLDASSGRWGVQFKADVRAYTDTLPEGVAKYAVRATGSYGKAKVFFQGKQLTVGTWSDSVALAEGLQTLKLSVVAENGDTAQYLLQLYRTSANAQLKSLSIAPGGLLPAFGAAVTNYAATLPFGAATVTVTGAPAAATGRIVKIGAKALSAKALNESIDLAVGDNVIPVTVRSEQGNEMIYVLNLHRQSGDAPLSKLTVSLGTLRPAFNAAISAYTDTVLNGQASLTLAPTAKYAYSKITVAGTVIVSGAATSAIPLSLGDNTIMVTVTAEDPSEDSVYTIKVYRKRSFNYSYKGPDGLNAASGLAGLQTPDSGFVMAGTVYGLGNMEACIIKTNQFGDTLWTRTFTGAGDDQFGDVRSTSDKGFILAGGKGGINGGQWDLSGTPKSWIVKTNSNGDTAWTRSFGDTLGEQANSIVPTADGGYLFTGTIMVADNQSGALITKINATGGLVKRTILLNPSAVTRGQKILATPDGGYIIVGTVAPWGNDPSFGYLIKLNAAGDTTWTRRLSGVGGIIGQDISNVGGGGYMVVGCDNGGTPSEVTSAIRTDAAGNILWTKTIGPVKYGRGNSIRPTSDNAFVIAAQLETPSGSSVLPYLFIIDASGNLLLSTPVVKNASDGGEGLYAQEIMGGGYVITGFAFLSKTDPSGTFK